MSGSVYPEALKDPIMENRGRDGGRAFIVATTFSRHSLVNISSMATFR